jgi:NADPH:quinone reductase-like Zn-dependent oxidoreductase
MKDQNMTTMKAAVFTQYGAPSVLHTTTVAKPSPKANEVLIKIHATAVNSGDCRMRAADPFAARFFIGLFKPSKQILGGVLSGVVEAVGQNVQQFKPGDEVFGSTTMDFGAYAEYIVLPETGALGLKPAALRHEEAAVIPFGGVSAWFFLQKANIQPRQKVLIYGASGAVGAAAVQIAKSLGAEVTGVCSTSNVELVKSLGADHVIDYTKTDFTQTGQQYDVVYETVNKTRVSSCASVLRKNGVLLLGAAMLPEMLRGAWATMTGGIKVHSGMAVPKAESIAFLRQLLEAGKLKPVIDKTYALEQLADAHAYVEKGHKKGNVVVTVG